MNKNFFFNSTVIINKIPYPLIINKKKKKKISIISPISKTIVYNIFITCLL